jgi:hypothetical protein
MSDELDASARYKYSGKETFDGLYYFGARNAASQVEPTTSADQDSASAAEATDLGFIPATEVKPEDIGALSLRYVDGVPVVVVSGGQGVPQTVAIVDESGAPVAAYSAGALSATARKAYSGIAAATALAMIPDVDQGK